MGARAVAAALNRIADNPRRALAEDDEEGIVQSVRILGVLTREHASGPSKGALSKRDGANVAELAADCAAVFARLANDPTQAITAEEEESIAGMLPLLAEASRRLARGRVAKRPTRPK